MKIGFDAKWFFNGPPSNSRVTRSIVSALAELDTEHTIYIFLDSNFRGVEFSHKSPKIVPVYMWAGVNLLSNVFLLPFYSRFYELDVLISQNFSPFFSTSRRITYIHDVIYASHPEYFSLLERLYFSPMRILARRADKVCTISYSEKERLLLHRFSNSPQLIDVIYHGIDPQFRPAASFAPSQLTKVRARYLLPKNYLLYVGRFNERKNLKNLLKAYSLIPREKIPLILVGRSDWKSFDVEAYIKELGLESDVRTLGYVEESDLPVIYALATVFCYVSSQEGFGLPPLESMASGVPVVVSNSSSLPEVCGDSAVYVNPTEPEDIARGIQRLVGDSSLYRIKREAALLRAGQFKWETAAKSLISVAESCFHPTTGAKRRESGVG